MSRYVFELSIMFIRRVLRRKIYILSANDRFNYGDLLFPYILMHYLPQYREQMVVCSTTESDLSESGALPTKDFSVLEHMSVFRRNVVIVGGGECLFCSWNDILGYVRENSSRSTDRFPTRYPFTIAKKELKHLDVMIYNAVGCHQLNEKKELYGNEENKEILADSDYISVRDSPTSLGISRMGLEHTLCPDSAILMSRVFPKRSLSDRVSEQTRLAQQRGPYLFFQIGLVHMKTWIEDYVKVLCRVYLEKGLHLCLCPIGTAIGHDDPIALKQIADVLSSMLPFGAYTLMNNPSVWDIMSLIANSEMYVGSSLHGAITAMSYNIPLVAFGPRKLQVYIETWYDTIGSEYSFVAIDNLEKKVFQRLENRFTISVEEQMKLAEQSLRRIRRIVSWH